MLSRMPALRRTLAAYSTSSLDTAGPGTGGKFPFSESLTKCPNAMTSSSRWVISVRVSLINATANHNERESHACMESRPFTASESLLSTDPLLLSKWLLRIVRSSCSLKLKFAVTSSMFKVSARRRVNETVNETEWKLLVFAVHQRFFGDNVADFLCDFGVRMGSEVGERFST